MAEHNTLSGADLHENKHISGSSTGDAGKVVTPSASDAGVGVLRNLLESEISTKTYALTVQLADVGSTTPAHVVVPFAGTLTGWYTVLHSAIATADAVVSIAIGGVATTPDDLTIAFSGSAAGDVDSLTITSNNAVVAGSRITITSDGAPSNSAIVTCTLIFTKA
jgi:hypothetical protein